MGTIFGGTPGLPDGGPVVFDGSDAALRQRTANFAARRYADMTFVSGLGRVKADRSARQHHPSVRRVGPEDPHPAAAPADRRVLNEIDHAMDMAPLNRLIAIAIDSCL